MDITTSREKSALPNCPSPREPLCLWYIGDLKTNLKAALVNWTKNTDHLLQLLCITKRPISVQLLHSTMQVVRKFTNFQKGGNIFSRTVGHQDPLRFLCSCPKEIFGSLGLNRTSLSPAISSASPSLLL